MPITDFDSAFWTDPWLRKRTPHARYLFSYLFTSPHKNRSGIYSIDLDQVEFETGMSMDKIKEAFKELEPKVMYDYKLEIVYVSNHVKHQFAKKDRISPTIATSIVSDLKKIPEGHDFIHLFIEKYGKFFALEGTVVIECAYSVGKGKEGERLKYNDAFDKFWKAYPARNGKKRGKPIAFEYFLKIKEDEWSLVIECSKNYAKSQGARSNFAKDPERFLKKNYWRDWTEPEEYVPEGDIQEHIRKLNSDISAAKQEIYHANTELKFVPKPTSEARVKKAKATLAHLQAELKGIE